MLMDPIPPIAMEHHHHHLTNHNHNGGGAHVQVAHAGHEVNGGHDLGQQQLTDLEDREV